VREQQEKTKRVRHVQLSEEMLERTAALIGLG